MTFGWTNAFSPLTVDQVQVSRLLIVVVRARRSCANDVTCKSEINTEIGTSSVQIKFGEAVGIAAYAEASSTDA